jgi:hypothetical protein
METGNAGNILIAYLDPAVRVLHLLLCRVKARE